MINNYNNIDNKNYYRKRLRRSTEREKEREREIMGRKTNEKQIHEDDM